MDSTHSAPAAEMPSSSGSSSASSIAAPAPMLHRLLIPLGNLLFRTRNVVFPIVFFALAAIFAPVWPANDQWADLRLDLIGIAIALFGQGLRYAVIGLAYIKRGGLKKQIYAKSLVTTGLFAHCRNPLYVGNFLMMLGLIIIHNSPWMYALGVPFFAVSFLAITLAEEQYLGNRFGDEYMEYCKSTPRFMIKFAGLAGTVRGMRFDWRKAINKEHGTTMTWTTTLLLLLAWERISNVGLEESQTWINGLLTAWAASFIVYVMIRAFKKEGWIDPQS